MPSPYLQSVKMTPAANPHVQGYVDKYDPSAELTKAAGELAVALADGVVRAKRREDRFSAQRLVSDYENEMNTFVRNAALNEKSFDKAKDGRTNFDVDFEKHKAERRKAFMEQCPSFERDNAEKLLNSIDLKAGNDVAYLKIKKANERTVVNLNHIIETRTAAYAGMSSAEQEENDRSVERTLNDAVRDGVITAAAKSRALEGYNYNKKKAQANHDILAQPAIAEEKLKSNAYELNADDLDALRTKFLQVMRHNNLKQQQIERSKQEADVLAVLQLIGEGRDIDTAIDAISDPDIVAGLRKKQESVTKGEKDVINNENLYFELTSMFDTDPAKFKNLNLYKHIGEFDSLAFRILKDRQDSLVLRDMEEAARQEGKESGKKEFEVKDSFLNPHENLKHSAYADLGLLKDTSDPDIARQRLDFDTRYAEIAEAEIGRLGRQLTRDEEAAIVNNLVKEVSIRKSWWFDSEKRAYQMDGTEQAYIPYKEINKEQRKEIESVFKNQLGVDLSSLSKSDRREAIEDMSAAFYLPEEAKYARMKVILERIATKITGEENEEVE